MFYGQAMTAGDIYTVAGTCTAGFAGDGGPATSAKLASPWRVAVDAAGNLVIAATGNRRIRVVAVSDGTFYGQAMTAGDIYTVAGGGTGGLGDGGPATSASLSRPEGVSVDAAGNLVIADTGDSRARVVAVSDGTFYGQAMTAGDIYTVAGGGTGGLGDGGPATSAKLTHLKAVTTDGAGNLVIADTSDNRVRVVAAGTGTFYGRAMTAGDIYTVAGTGRPAGSGDGGLATHAVFLVTQAVAVGATGNLAIADRDSNQVWVVAGNTATFYGRAMTAGHVYRVAGTGTPGFSGDGGPATKAKLNSPQSVTVDAAGNLLIADETNNRVRVVAVSNGTFYGQAMTAGDIYTVAGDGAFSFAGDGGPATSAGLSCTGVAVDAAGNLVISDQANERIRVVAASTGTFFGQAMTAGDIYTVAGDGTGGWSGNGGPATSAELLGPEDVALDSTGNLLITAGNQIRLVAASTGMFYGQAMTAGDIYAIAGTGFTGYSGDGGRATRAKFDFVTGVTVDAAGNPVVSDTLNSRVRVVAASTGRFYGQAMKAGDIYTVAGTGVSQFSGDGGPARKAELAGPLGVTVNAAGNLLIADWGRIRMVTR
jgi:hypothetical protein